MRSKIANTSGLTLISYIYAEIYKEKPNINYIEELISNLEPGNINIIIDKWSGTLLHHAVQTFNSKIVELFIKYNADLNAKNENRERPLELAKRQMKEIKLAYKEDKSYFSDFESAKEIVQLLENHMCNSFRSREESGKFEVIKGR
ncbi:MAG: hypothetical protein J0H68_02790 [Sphingobacteriia bacterium]|nr:hypothetical protein [Sphingobacteriia bacterium]